jgi:hypothetical protein
MVLLTFVGPWPLFSVSWSFYTIDRTHWTGDQPVSRPLPTQRTARTQNKLTQTSMPQVDFELTILVFEREKTVHALDRAVTVFGGTWCSSIKFRRIVYIFFILYGFVVGLGEKSVLRSEFYVLWTRQKRTPCATSCLSVCDLVSESKLLYRLF